MPDIRGADRDGSTVGHRQDRLDRADIMIAPEPKLSIAL